MTDDARIARLTLLARRVWPDTRVIAWPEHIYVEDETPVQRASVFGHPRALDALEAALLVLAGESAADDVVTLAAKLHGGPMRARMMELATEWEASAHGRRDAHAEDEAQVYFDCAAELRERAKGTP